MNDFPSGTRLRFYQPTPPPGWCRVEKTAQPEWSVWDGIICEKE